MKILFATDAVPVAGPSTPSPDPSVEPSNAPTAPLRPPEAKGPAEPPRAATIVQEGTVSEREEALQRELDGSKARVTELEAETALLKTPAPLPAAQPAKKKSGWTIL